jgi:hypothetical protein
MGDALPVLVDVLLDENSHGPDFGIPGRDGLLKDTLAGCRLGGVGKATA